MCGISGLYLSGRVERPPFDAEAVVRAMNHSMAHRGPDADGVWADPAGRCILGHRRLSIIDTSDAGRQPMLGLRSPWIISFNGELYNFQEIRPELERLGVQFHGRTDTEVLLQAITLWGTEALPRLDGMFAFAAFNRESGEIMLARDPFGEKPLYCAELPGGGLAFASELQALELVPGVDASVSEDSIAELLMFQYIGAPRTIYRRVSKLPPGHWLVVRPGAAARTGRYFGFAPGSTGFDRRPLEELADELEDILVRSLRRRLIADVPLGAFLSGGIDSSTVCALIRRRLERPLMTYSIGFEGAAESEHATARLFAQHLGTEHHEKIVAPDASQFLYGIGRLLDEPNADSSCLPTYLLSAFARASVTVALSGDGGDEMFGGYGRYFHTADEAERFGNGAVPGWNAGAAYYSNRILVSTEEHIEELFGGMPAGAAEHLRRVREEVASSAQPILCRLRRTDVDNYMPGAVLPKVDRMSMQHALEVRTPFLSIELARFAERLPPDALYSGKQGKRVLRALAYRYLPRELIDLPKQGFALPMVRWGREELLAVAGRLLESQDSVLRRALGPTAINRFMKRQSRSGGFSTYQVWALAMLESWLRHHPAKLQPYRGAHAATIDVGTPEFFGFPIGDGLLGVTRARSLDEAGKRREQVEANTQKTAWLAGFLLAQSPSLGAPPQGPWALASMDRAVADRLKGATLVLDTEEDAKALTQCVVEAWRDAGVVRFVVRDPSRPNGTFLRFELHHHPRRRRLANLRRLRSQATASWWALFARRSHGGRLLRVGPLPRVEGPLDVELAARYALLRGAQQWLPLPCSHEDMADAAEPRYSVWSRYCFFNALRPSQRLGRYWLVEQTPATRDLLPIAVDVIRPEVETINEFCEVLREVTATPTAPWPALRDGDKVVVVTSSLQPGGAERQWCYLAIGLKQRGFDVCFLVHERLEGQKAHYRSLLEVHGIPAVEIADYPVAKALDKLPQDSDLVRLLKAQPFDFRLVQLAGRLSDLRPQAVFAQLDRVNIEAGIASVIAGVPRCVLSFRNYNPTHFSYLRNTWFRPYYQALLESPRILLSGNSRAANCDYAAWLGVDAHRVTLVPNSIDSQDFKRPSSAEIARLREELRLPTGMPVILGVFRLSEEKDPRTFLEVCAAVAQVVPGLRVLIAGAGPLEKEMEKLIETLGIKDAVTLLGLRSDIPALMTIASLVLLTSTHEGMPNVLMEAQLLGVPVVATRVGGSPDVVVDGVTGYLRPAGDVAGLADACISVLRNPDLIQAMAAAGRQRTSDAFSRKSMVDAFVALASAPSRSFREANLSARAAT